MFPSLKARDLLAVLRRKLGYEIDRQRGSHRWLISSLGYPPFSLAYHEGATFPPGAVKKILTKDVGLSEQEALDLL